jgi:hypothetical protein
LTLVFAVRVVLKSYKGVGTRGESGTCSGPSDVILLTTLVGRVHKHVKIAAVFANLEGDKANTRCFIAVRFLKAVIY